MTPLDPVELLERLVRIDSQSPEPGEAEIATFVDELARSMGFETRIFAAKAGRPNVIVTIDAGPGPALGLCGHLDTKPVGDAAHVWRTPPLELTVDGDLAYGLGTSDMKGALAAMLVAAQAWAAEARRGRLCLVLTADEEAGSEFGARALSGADLVNVDAMVIGEPSGIIEPWEALFVVSRGVCCFDILIEGTQGHSGLSGRLPTSATVAAARALLALHDLQPVYPHNEDYQCKPTVNAGVRIEGGVFYGVHPGHASVACDVRLVPGMTREGLDRDVRAALAAAMPEDVRWSVCYRTDQLGWMPAVEISPSHPLVEVAQHACRSILGTELPLAAYPGGTDATAFTEFARIPCIASLGPGWLSLAHGPNECVGLSQVREAARIYQLVATKYLDR